MQNLHRSLSSRGVPPPPPCTKNGWCDFALRIGSIGSWVGRDVQEMVPMDGNGKGNCIANLYSVISRETDQVLEEGRGLSDTLSRHDVK